MYDLPMPTFFELYIMEEFLEPQSPQTMDTHFALLQDAIYRSSGNVSKIGLQKMKLKDFKLLNDETIFLSEEEKAEKNKKREKTVIAGAIAGLPKQEQERLQKLMNKGATNG